MSGRPDRSSPRPQCRSAHRARPRRPESSPPARARRPGGRPETVRGSPGPAPCEPSAADVVKARTSSEPVSYQVSDPGRAAARAAARAARGRARASSPSRRAAGRRRARRTRAAAAARPPAPGPNPSDGVLPSHGIGTRQPSRPRSVWFERSQVGSWRTSSGSRVASGRPSSSPWYRYADPGSAEHDRRGRAGAPEAEGGVGLRVVGADAARLLQAGRLLVPQPGRMPDDVVVGQHPRLRCADGLGRGERLGDRGAQVLGEPWRHQELEVERLVELVAAHVTGQRARGLHPGLGAEDAVGDPRRARAYSSVIWRQRR